MHGVGEALQGFEAQVQNLIIFHFSSLFLFPELAG
jgi:hypothetical protein